MHGQVRLWRVDDWAPVVTVSEPFQKGWVSNTFSLRLGWSPDGQHLAAVNSYQSPCHTAALLDRRTWKYDFSFVGHNGERVIAGIHVLMSRLSSPDWSECFLTIVIAVL